MAELKTRKTDDSVEKFLDSVEDEKRREDCYAVLKLMKKATRSEPKMWGDSIVGFGNYRCKYESGREVDWFITGFSPRKQNLALYVTTGYPMHEKLLSKLGKHKTGKSCLYINKLEDINKDVLKELIEESVEFAKQ